MPTVVLRQRKEEGGGEGVEEGGWRGEQGEGKGRGGGAEEGEGRRSQVRKNA